jgi:hypothetical protein
MMEKTIDKDKFRCLKNFYAELKTLYNSKLYLPREASAIIYYGDLRRSSSIQEIKSFLIDLIKILSDIAPEIEEDVKEVSPSMSVGINNTFKRIEKEANDCLDDMAKKNLIFLGKDIKSLFFDLEFVVASLSKIEGFEKLIKVREHYQLDFVHYTERVVKECERPPWGHGWKKQNPQTGEWEWWKEDWDSSD